MSQWSEAGDPGPWMDQRVSARGSRAKSFQNAGFVGGRHTEREGGGAHTWVCAQSDTHSTEVQALECWQGQMASEEEGVWVGRGLSTQGVSWTGRFQEL